jgi:hypothetical protein
MERRVTFTTVVNDSGRKKAIQPRGDDLVVRLLEAALADWKSQVQEDHDGISVIHVTVTKEVLSGETESEVNHRRETRINFEYLPQSIAEKEAARGVAAPGPIESDKRLRKLVIGILSRIHTLVFDSFLVEFMKESGKQAAKKLLTLVSLLIALFIYLVFHR